MKFENTEVFNFDGAIRGMRNPKESWNKSDSWYSSGDYGTQSFHIGKKTLNLCRYLSRQEVNTVSS